MRVGMEATGHARWFERLLAELGFELWIGDPAEIKTKRVQKQKTDREDARLMLKLLRENRFPKIWVPSPDNRDVRQLLWHRHRLVQMRTWIMNQLQAVAMNEGYRWKKKLFSAQGRALLEKLSLAPWASRRKASSSTTVVSSHNPSVFGQSVTFTATVAAVAPGSGTPTGTVKFKNGATVLGTGTLGGGKATFSTSVLAVGPHSITAVYGGSANYNTSTSTVLTETVNKAASSTKLTSSLNPSTLGKSVTFTITVVTVAPGSGTPTGTVTLKNGATAVGTATLASGKATISTSALTHGAHSMTAVYSGNVDELGSTSTILTQTVN